MNLKPNKKTLTIIIAIIIIIAIAGAAILLTKMGEAGEESLEEYTLTINVNGEGSTNPEQGNHTYTNGTEIPTTADPKDGWEFIRWTGDYNNTEKEITLIIDSDKEITAQFVENPNKISKAYVNAIDEGNIEEAKTYTTGQRLETLENKTQEQIQERKELSEKTELTVEILEENRIEENYTIIHLNITETHKEKDETTTLERTYQLIKENKEWKIRSKHNEIIEF